MKKPMVLLILDGWGYREQSEYNAINGTHTPVWDHLWSSYPHTLIDTSGQAVGLPAGQMGNSEVGHMNLGAGRVVYQELTRIDKAIETGDFFDNPVLCQAVDQAVANDKAVHVMGLLSPGGVHSHESHIQAMLALAVRRGARHLYLHAFLDGRDTPPRSASASIAAMEDTFAELGTGRIASLVGRYYAMDRDKRWERLQKAYDLLTLGRGEHRAASAAQALELAYARGENDEFVQATAIAPPTEDTVSITDGDAVVFMNFRADRAREITHAFTESDFTGFERLRRPQLSSFVCLTQYQRDIKAPVAFPPTDLHNGFGEILAQRGLRQLRLAETEKYAHVTFFFNGGKEAVYDGEDRILVPSPKVATYDLQPQMNAEEVTDKLVAAITGGQYDAIICNYANPDMVGHTGIYEAAAKAVETIDACLDRIYQALQSVGGEMLITADHGNIETMQDENSGQPNTAHTTNPVPLVYIGRPASLAEGGSLSDIAPSLLYLMGITQPPEMTGRSLVSLN